MRSALAVPVRVAGQMVAAAAIAAAAQVGETRNTVVVITSDASNYVLHAGGTIAKMTAEGMDAYVLSNICRDLECLPNDIVEYV